MITKNKFSRVFLLSTLNLIFCLAIGPLAQAKDNAGKTLDLTGVWSQVYSPALEVDQNILQILVTTSSSCHAFPPDFSFKPNTGTSSCELTSIFRRADLSTAKFAIYEIEITLNRMGGAGTCEFMIEDRLGQRSSQIKVDL